MSSLEERREARRRRRQQEEESQLNGTQTVDVDERLAQRRKEREERLQRIAAGLNSINGEDELEIRRRERREQRLRGSAATEETTSRRSRRNRGGDDTEESTEEVSSFRSRRRRGYDDEDQVDTSAPAEEESTPQVDQEEEERKRREAEEEEERQREEAQRRQEEEDRRRREAEERRRQEEEEDRRRQEEEDYLKHQQYIEEEKENVKQNVNNSTPENLDLYIDEDSWSHSQENSINSTEEDSSRSEKRGVISSTVKSNPGEISLQIRILDNRKYSEESKESGNWKRRSENEKCGRLKSHFEEEIDKSKDQPPEPLKRQVSKSRSLSNTSSTSSIDDVHGHNQLQDRMLKFQSSVQDNLKVTKVTRPIVTPGVDKLKDIQKRFEEDKDHSKSSSQWGGSGAKDRPSVNGVGGVHKTSDKSVVLNRWQPAAETSKSSVKSPLNKNSPSAKSVGKISSIASKFDHVNDASEKLGNKDSKSSVPSQNVTKLQSRQSNVLDKWQHGQEETITPVTTRWQQSEPVTSNTIPKVQQQRQSSTLPRVASRWQPDKKDTNSPKIEKMVDTKKISTGIKVAERWKWGDVKTSPRRQLSNSSQGSSQDTPTTYEEEERRERERLEEEEREREEAARRMEEEQKKKRKRKGLGGLSPEKKKMLKKLIMQKAAEDLKNEAKAKAEEKEKYINERVEPLKTDGLGEADLQRLCKKLHAKVAQLEEEVYDWEVKIRKQDFEINELALKVNDSKGKFIKPVLRKVNKTENKLGKLMKKDKADFRDNLKSTGQSKFALDEEEEKAE